MEFVSMYETDGYYKTNLDFNEKTLSEIVNEIYMLENDTEEKYSSKIDNSVLKNGFYSCNLLDPDILKKCPYIEITISRIQELLFNYFETKVTNFTNNPHILKINEIRIIISRMGDYNLVNQYGNSYISGIFNLKNIPKKNVHPIDDALHFIKNTTQNFFLPSYIKNENTINLLKPEEGEGIIFPSQFKHVIYPHNSHKDSIKLIFNATIDYDHHYDKLYPIPYWTPINYYTKLDKEIHCKEDNKIVVIFKNGKGILIPHNYSEDELNEKNGSILEIDKEALKSIIKDYTKDMSHIFNDPEEKKNSMENNKENNTMENNKENNTMEGYKNQ